jgi:hypothetical protein
VGIGSVINVVNENGKTERFSILSPWDANPDENILSFSSSEPVSVIEISPTGAASHKDDRSIDFADVGWQGQVGVVTKLIKKNIKKQKTRLCLYAAPRS